MVEDPVRELLLGGDAAPVLVVGLGRGPLVVHCHMTSHEDLGMMMKFSMDDTQGAQQWAGAKQVDPSCIPYDVRAGDGGDGDGVTDIERAFAIAVPVVCGVIIVALLVLLSLAAGRTSEAKAVTASNVELQTTVTSATAESAESAESRT